MGMHGAAASAHPLASLAGLRMLMDGGNAVDAAVAIAAALNVCEPFMSGAGGVGLMLLHLADDGETKMLDFSGRAPKAASPEEFTPETQERGIRAPLVPGNLGGWLEALEKHGTMSREKVFGPAIEYADGGFPLTNFGHEIFDSCAPLLRKCPNATAAYLINGEAPAPGQMLRQPDLANTYRLLVKEGASAFYEGEIAQTIASFSQEEDGLITLEDLNESKPTWRDVITTEYRGYTVTTAPPNCEGFQMLEALNILEEFDLAGMGHNSAEYIHLIAEAFKIAVTDRIIYCGDPKFIDIPVDGLISKAYAAERRKLINLDRANVVMGERWEKEIPQGAMTAGNPLEHIPGMTTHFAAVDSDGNVASITQTLGGGFGCGRVVPGTGLTLNNGINWMEVDPACDTPNLIEGGRQWSQPMAPLQVYKDGKFCLSVSTPGSYGILQTTLQMMLNHLEFGASIQEAIEAPRIRTWGSTVLSVEDRIAAEVRDELAELGHEIELLPAYSAKHGGGQGVTVDLDSGARTGGADPRRDGVAIAF